MRRLTRGRAATDDEATPPVSGASEAVGDAAPNADPAPTAAGEDASASEAPTIVSGPGESAGVETAAADATEVADRPRDLPAGLDPDALAAAPASSARRSRLRRRLYYLRHARELLLRDLGGFYYEAHRSEAGADAHRRLLEVKARRLSVLDAEVRELEERLSEEHPQAVLREPGIGGTCPHCGELHGSDARFCPRCGSPLRGRAARRPDTPSEPVGPVEEQGRPTTASLWGRRHTPAPPDPTQAASHEDAGSEPPEPAADEPPAAEDRAPSNGADRSAQPAEEPRP